MRDIHLDGAFLRDFNDASKQWSWATWHEIRAAEELTARRLLEEVFDQDDERPASGQATEEE